MFSLKDTSSSLPPVGSISNELFSFYSGLDVVQKNIFKRCYRYIFNYLFPLRDAFADSAPCYLFIMLTIRNKHSLSYSELSILGMIWLMTGAGRDYADTSGGKTFDNYQYRSIKQLVDKGYLSRHFANPLRPYSCRLYNASWIGFTPDGIALYKQVLKDYHKAVLQFHSVDWGRK